MRHALVFALLCLVLGLVCAACGEAAEEAAPEPKAAEAQPAAELTADKVLDAAIEAAGGLDKLKATASWKGKSKGTFMGMPYKSSNIYKNGIVRMDIIMGDGNDMGMVMGPDPCWMTSGPVVIPCSKEERESNKVMSAISQAIFLWPLKEAGWEVSLSGKADVNGKPCDVLAVKNAASGAEGKLAIDAETHLLAQVEYTVAMHGKPTKFVGQHTNYKDFCGAKLAATQKMTMNGMPYVEEEVLEVACGPVDDAELAPPEQVKDGTVLERTVTPYTSACVLAKGPYDGIGASIGKLMQLVEKEQLMPIGPPVMVYVKAPPAVKDPAKFETDVCLPVGAPPPVEPQVKGDLTIKAFAGAKVLSAYGIGPYDKKSEELVELVMAEAGKRKLKPAGPLRQRTFSDPETVPPAEQVSEMQIPIQ
jgi:effector-binding domain-containing protein